MSSESEDDHPGELPFDLDEVMAAKRNNPGMFVSAWQADENDINAWSAAEIRADPAKKLIVSAERGDLPTVVTLLNSIPNTDAKTAHDLLSAKDQDGYTALHRAAYGGHADTLKYLIEQGANINNRTIDGWTPLHSAAFWNQLACVQLLLDAGADITAVTNSKQTALHLAVSNNQGPETLYLLLSQPGVPVYEMKNHLGDTVFDLIQRNTPHGDICYPFSEPATCLLKKC